MSKSNHTEAQMIGAIKQVEAGRKADEVAREIGVSKHTIYAWKQKYRGLVSIISVLATITRRQDLSMDSAMSAEDDAGSAHSYLYGGSDPVDQRDPMGRDFESVLSASVVVSVAATFAPVVPIKNNFVQGTFGTTPFLFVCIMSEVASDLRNAAGLQNWGDCVNNANVLGTPGNPPKWWPPWLPRPTAPQKPHNPGCCSECGTDCKCGSPPSPAYLLKPGVPAPSPTIDSLLKCIAAKTCSQLIVTSTSDSHAPTDQHSRGLAVDIRYPSNAGDAKKLLCAGGACGAGFGLDEKIHPSGPKVKPHIHLQIYRRGTSPGDIPKTKCCGN